MDNGKRIAAERRARGLTQIDLARMVGCSQADIQRLEAGKVRNSKYLQQVLAVLQIGDTQPHTIMVVGYIGAGAEVFAIDDHMKGDGLDEVPAPPGMLNGIALIVRGDSMAPKYEDGDVIYIEKTLYAADALIGAVCYVQLADGRTYLKRLQHGQKAGTFNLISLNGPVITDVVVERAYPVSFVRPRQFSTR
jgi:phage repressor protein C with HTH and peptisase S24 domain